MRRAYIDGENLVHIITHALVESKVIKNRDELKNFDFIGFLNFASRNSESTKVDANYYGAKLKVIKSSPALEKKTLKMIKWNENWVNKLNDQKLRYIKSGQLKLRDSHLCGNCNTRDLILQEKGVDVALAVDIVSDVLKGDVKTVVLVSGDSDLIPAAKRAHSNGAEVVYVAYSKWVNHGLSNAADEVVTVTQEDIVGFYKTSKPKDDK